jgi:prepilin-type N-terminal cleavage/methylation domain-containing protein
MDDFPKNKLKGFALIEVLIALAVVVVFYCFILPFGKAVFDRVHIMTDRMKMSFLVCNIREHANACEGMRDLISCVEALAQSDAIFDDLEAWQSPKRKGGVQKRNVLGSDGYFASDLRKSDFDYILVHPLPQNSNPWAPVCYTRGLLPNGQWAEDGLYGSKYGLIAFASGHVNLFLETVSKDILAYIFSDIGGRADSDGANPEFIETPLF